MTDTIPAFPNLLNHVWIPILNEGNVHSSLVVSMRRKSKPEGHMQNNCSYEFYLNELRVKKAISNIYPLKVTMKADILQARGGFWFAWSYLQIPTHVLSPRPSIMQVCPEQRGCAGLVFTQRMSWAVHAPKYCRCKVSTPSSTFWLRCNGHLTAKKNCVPQHIYYRWAIFWSSVILDCTDDCMCRP